MDGGVQTGVTGMTQARRCLVLGGGGFIGSHLVERLLKGGYRVRCFDRSRARLLVKSHLLDPHFELFEGDFALEEDVAAALEGCDACFHLVSTTSPKTSNDDPVFDVETNALGTLRLLTHVVKSGVKKIVFVSSGGTVYGIPNQVPIPETHSTDPVCSYGITKLAIEKYLELFRQLHGLNYAALRVANPYGILQRVHAAQGAVAVFLGKALNGETIEIWGDGTVVRDYVYISDVADALVLALENETGERIFNIGSGRGHSVNEVLDLIEKVTQRRVLRRYLPSRSCDVSKSVLSIERAVKFLGWSPQIELERGIQLFSDWLQDERRSAQGR